MIISFSKEVKMGGGEKKNKKTANSPKCDTSAIRVANSLGAAASTHCL